jgi:hypothetical protein
MRRRKIPGTPRALASDADERVPRASVRPGRNGEDGSPGVRSKRGACTARLPPRGVRRKTGPC